MKSSRCTRTRSHISVTSICQPIKHNTAIYWNINKRLSPHLSLAPHTHLRSIQINPYSFPLYTFTGAINTIFTLKKKVNLHPKLWYCASYSSLFVISMKCFKIQINNHLLLVNVNFAIVLLQVLFDPSKRSLLGFCHVGHGQGEDIVDRLGIAVPRTNGGF